MSIFAIYSYSTSSGRVFSDSTEVVAESLIPLDTILPEICSFIIGFSCTVGLKTRPSTGSLADSMLGHAILVLPLPPKQLTNIRKVKGPQKVCHLVTQNHLRKLKKNEM